MQPPVVKLATINGVIVKPSAVSEESDNPQTMFYRFAPTSELDIGGINGANEFRRLFLGWYRFIPVPCVIEQIRSKSEEKLINLIMTYGGGYSCEEAERLIRKALGHRIYYENKQIIQKVGSNWFGVDHKKYFTLCQWVGERYYLELTED